MLFGRDSRNLCRNSRFNLAMERADDPQLWDLLKHSKAPEPSPFFARDVLRAVRNEKTSPSVTATWFSMRRLIPSLSAVAAVIIALFTVHTLHNRRPARSGEQIASIEVADAELATDVDVLSGDDDADDAPLL